MFTGAGAGEGAGAGAGWCGALSQLPERPLVTTQHSEIRDLLVTAQQGSRGLGCRTESSKTSRLEKQEIEHRCCAFM